MLKKVESDEGPCYVNPLHVSAIGPRDDRKKGCCVHMAAADLWWDLPEVHMDDVANEMNKACEEILAAQKEGKGGPSGQKRGGSGRR